MVDIPVLLILGAIGVGLYARLPHWFIGLVILAVLVSPFAAKSNGGKRK